MYKFSANIEIIGVNPFVFVPEKILAEIFKNAGKNKGPIPICGTINEKQYRQTLVRFQDEWRLYINTMMLKNSPKRIGEKIDLTVMYDGESRAIEPPKKWLVALNKNKDAKEVFDALPASRRHEITRYIANLKTEEARDKNIQRAIGFLLGRERFVGRDKP